jgi:hypothetical protein
MFEAPGRRTVRTLLWKSTHPSSVRKQGFALWGPSNLPIGSFSRLKSMKTRGRDLDIANEVSSEGKAISHVHRFPRPRV